MTIWDSIEIVKKTIFKFITQEAIFERFLGLGVDDTVFYTNPLPHRSDRYPDCKYFYAWNGRLWFVDFAERSYDCFNIVQTLYRRNYWTACKIIAKEFGLLKTDEEFERPQFLVSLKKEKAKVILRKKVKNYYPKEALDFWKRFHLRLTDDELKNELKVHGIMVLDAAWIQYPESDEYPEGYLKQVYDYNKKRPAFCYQLTQGDDFQFYFPFNSKESVRFMQNRNDILHFYNNLPERGDYVVITKSRKDAFLLRMFGVEAIAIISERITYRKSIDRDIMINLNLRFNKVFTLFDNDRTGKRASIVMKNLFQTIPPLFPSEYAKDFADNLEAEGADFMSDWIEELKQEYEL